MTKLEKAEALLLDRETDFPEHLYQAKEFFLELTGGKQAGLAYTRLSETMFWLGEYAAERSDQEEFHGEGVEFGKSAVRLNGKDAAAHLWYAANMGAHGVARGVMSSLYYLKDIEKHGKRALELDETHFHGAPLRLLGRFYHQAPGFPIGPGNTRKAVELLERAVQAGPKFLLNHLYLADAYITLRRRDEARALLKKILDAPEPKQFADYQGMVQHQAMELLDKLG